MRQRIVWLLPCLLLCLTAKSQVSYWFQGFQRQGNAQYAQQYFFLAGSNVVITYTNPYVYINATGGGGSSTGCCPIVSFATNSLFATNALFATNWVYSNTFWLIVSTNFQPYCSNLLAWCTNDPSLYTNGLGASTSCCPSVAFATNSGSAQTLSNLPNALIEANGCAYFDNFQEWFCGGLSSLANSNVLIFTDGSGGFIGGLQPGGGAHFFWSIDGQGSAFFESNVVSQGIFYGNGFGLTNIQCTNITGTCFDTNGSAQAVATNATNYANTVFLVSSNYTTNLVFTTSNALYFIGTGSLLTNNNTWTGTNMYTKNMYVVGPLFVGGTNLGVSCMTVPTAHFGVALYQGGNGAVFIIKENCDMQANLAGCTIANVFTNCGSYNAIEIDGAGLHLASRSTDPIRLYINGADSGRMDTYQNWLVGTNVNYANDSGHHGSITATNSIYAWNYLKGHRGLIITTNSFSRGTNMAVADPFNNGDLMVASSNGVPYAIAKNQTGVCTTNLMLYVAETATNDWHTAGNTGMGAPGGTFGTLDNSPVNIKINNVAAGRLDSLPTIALGVGATASVANDVAIAPTSVANGGGATAVGFNAQATAVGATALGYGAGASGFGATAIGRSSTAQGEFSFANGLNAGQLSLGNFTVMMGNEAGNNATTLFNTSSNAFMLGYNTGAGGNFSYAIGKEAVALNDGSIVFSDSTSAGYSDTKTNQFIVYASGGIDLHSAGAGTKTDGPLEVQTSTFSTNGYYYSASTNGVAPPPVVIQPLHMWASLMMTNTNTFNFGANTYGPITNYSVVRTNVMLANKAHGCVTNTIPGYYYCGIHMSAKSLDAGAFVEGDLLLNGVARDEISFQSQFDPGTPRYKGLSAFGILYVTNNTQITFQIKTSGASGIEVSRAQLVVMPP